MGSSSSMGRGCPLWVPVPRWVVAVRYGFRFLDGSWLSAMGSGSSMGCGCPPIACVDLSAAMEDDMTRLKHVLNKKA